MAASEGCAVAVHPLNVGSQGFLGFELVGAGRADPAAVRGDLDRDEGAGDEEGVVEPLAVVMPQRG